MTDNVNAESVNLTVVF